MHRCSFVHDDILPTDLREQLEEYLYTSFYKPVSDGRAEPRTSDTRTVQPEPDSLGHPTVPPETHSLDHPTVDVARSVVNLAQFINTTNGQSELSEKVSHDVVHWLENRWAQAREARRFAQADSRIANLSTDAAEPILRSVGVSPEKRRAILEEAHALEAAREDGFAGCTAVVRARIGKSRLRRRRVLLSGAVESAMRNWERSFIQSGLPAYVDELNAAVPKAAEQESKIRDIFGTTPQLWDASHGTLTNIDWPLLEHYGNVLKSEPSVRALADLLGRGSAAADRDAPLVPVEVVYEREDVEYYGRSEVRGVTFGKDLASLLPPEIALLASDETEALFDRHFAEGRLLTFDYKSAVGRRRSETRIEYQPAAAAQGPIVLCVDVSGSMAGVPERVAKACALAVTRSALEFGRRCYLISFSDKQAHFEATQLAENLQELVDFLGLSYRGGTEIGAALQSALDLVETERYQNADVLVISDFRVPKLFTRLTRRLSAVRDTTGLRLFSLTVTDKPVDDYLNVFDRRFHYDTSGDLPRGIPLRSLRHVE